MPIHDWTRVTAGDFHHFHERWIQDIAAALNKGCLPPDYMALTKPDVALRDLDAILRNGDPSRVMARIELGIGVGNNAGVETTIRLYSGDRVPSLSTLLPALQNALFVKSKWRG